MTVYVRILLAWSFALVSLTGCAKQSAPAGPSQLEERIVVSGHLLAEWAEPLAEACQIELLRLQPAGADAEHALPSRESLRAAQSARLILVHGAGWESWLKQVALPASRMVVTATPGAQGWMHRTERTHSHGLAGSHTHAARHPRTWFDPQAVKLQVDAIAAAIESSFELEPSQLDALQQAHLTLLADVAQYAAALSEFRDLNADLAVIASSEEFAYLARPFARPIPVVEMAAETEWTGTLRNQLRAAMPTSKGGYVLFSSAPSIELSQRMQDELDLSALVVPIQATGEAGSDWLKQTSTAFFPGNF